MEWYSLGVSMSLLIILEQETDGIYDRIGPEGHSINIYWDIGNMGIINWRQHITYKLNYTRNANTAYNIGGDTVPMEVYTPPFLYLRDFTGLELQLT